MNRPTYSTDLTDAQWELIAPLLPPPKPGGRPQTVDRREILNAIFYLLRTGCPWRMLPHDFPFWSTVHYYYWNWRKDGTWQKIHTALRKKVRVADGRDEEPSAGIIDSQTVKTTEAGGPRGFDGGKLIQGRKRHIMVDTLGMLLLVVVHSAGIQDKTAARFVLSLMRFRFPRLQLIWADGGYTGPLIEWVKQTLGWVLEIVKKRDGQKGFEVLPRRWVVERTFAWIGRNRRLSKDYEAVTQSSEAMVYLAMIHLMVRRLQPSHAPP